MSKAVALSLAVLVVAVVFMGLAGSMGGMKSSADTIGESVSNAIENASQPVNDITDVLLNDPAGDPIDIAAAEQAAMQDFQLAVYWKGSQTLQPGRHAIERHGADAWASVDCYNRNGAFMIFANKDGDFNLLCKDDDGRVRNVMLKRRGNSNIFDFKNAYTAKDGVFARIDHWLRTTWKSSPTTMPNDAVIVIDGVTP